MSERRSGDLSTPSRVAALFWLGAAVTLSGVSLGLFAAFLWAGSLHLVRLDLGERGRLALDAGLCGVFFFQHSGMVRRAWRARVGRLYRDELHGAVYAAASGLALLLLVVAWQESGIVVARAGGLARVGIRSLYFVAIVGFLWSFVSIPRLDPLGQLSILRLLRGRAPRPALFTVRGTYRWVRHPLYLCSLMMIWSSPDLTADRLLFASLFTVWIVVAARLEERDLVAAFGDAYVAYRRQVPMLIPYRAPRSPSP